MGRGICVAAAGQIRHKRTLRSRDVIEVTVYPDDGRFPETFQMSAAELRRFAWGVLADLDPIETRAAANEDGVDLDTMTNPPPMRRGMSRHGLRRPPANALAPGDERHRLLIDLGRRGPLRYNQVQAVLDADSRLPGVMDKLRRLGLADRTGTDGRACRGVFSITDKGREELERLAERRAA